MRRARIAPNSTARRLRHSTPLLVYCHSTDISADGTSALCSLTLLTTSSRITVRPTPHANAHCNAALCSCNQAIHTCTGYLSRACRYVDPVPTRPIRNSGSHAGCLAALHFSKHKRLTQQSQWPSMLPAAAASLLPLAAGTDFMSLIHGSSSSQQHTVAQL